MSYGDAIWYGGVIKGVDVPRRGYRWQGTLLVEVEDLGEIAVLMAGVIAQWFKEGDQVKIGLIEEPKKVGEHLVLGQNDFILDKVYDGDRIRVWPPFSKQVVIERSSYWNRSSIYRYRILAREAISERDLREVVSLEQYHYASKEVVVAVWRCPICGRFIESNTQPTCPDHGIPAKLQEIRGSLPSSRFLILELVDREPYEPKIVGYVRVDTPIPLMNRRIVENGRILIEKMIREKVFPKNWFHPTYWPLEDRKEILSRYRNLIDLYGSSSLARTVVGEEISGNALHRTNTSAARIARVVIHPDYRGDGLGVVAVKMAIEWIKSRRIPEMKKKKHVVETIAQMARYNPFFEKAGFKYLWDTGSGRPVLFYPITKEAEQIIGDFLKKDKYASKHGGRLYTSRIGTIQPITKNIVIKNLSKMYSSILDVRGLPEKLQEVLRAFGVERRLVERYVLRDVNFEIKPGEIVAVVGASGAGKTTLLRMIIGASMKKNDVRYKPNKGVIEIPENTRLSAFLPGELEPEFGQESLLEHMYVRLKDEAAAVELLNMVGLSDAVFYRARFTELSTGQKERAKLASILSTKPNLVVIDEFAAHLDPNTARRVARKIGVLARKMNITLIVSSNRSEILEALAPDSMIYVGYGTAYKIDLRNKSA